MHQCRRPYQSTRPALRSGTCSGPDMSLHVMTRSAGLLNSPGLQALSMHQSMHQCRRRYQSTRPVPLHGPHQSTTPALRSGTCSGPDMSLHVMTRSASLLNLATVGTCTISSCAMNAGTSITCPTVQALSMHQSMHHVTSCHDKVRRPSKFTRSAGLINAPVPQALSIEMALAHSTTPPSHQPHDKITPIFIFAASV